MGRPLTQLHPTKNPIRPSTHNTHTAPPNLHFPPASINSPLLLESLEQRLQHGLREQWQFSGQLILHNIKVQRSMQSDVQVAGVFGSRDVCQDMLEVDLLVGFLEQRFEFGGREEEDWRGGGMWEGESMRGVGVAV